MATDEIPDWAQIILEKTGATVEFKDPADMEGRYFAPDETSWGTHLLELAPAITDLAKFESEDEDEGYGIIHNIDLLEVQQVLDETRSLSFGIEEDGSSCITIKGILTDHNVVVRIYDAPFLDADPDDVDSF